MSKNAKKLTLGMFVLMMITSVFGVVNISIGYYRMGYAAIPFFIIGGLFFFIPFLCMMIEFGTGFRETEGGIYSWMKHSTNGKFALYGIFMWYSSYLIWMFTKALNTWIPLSFTLFGVDKTTNMGPLMLSVLGLFLIFGITVLLKRGPNRFGKVASIGGIAVISLNIVLLIGGILVLAFNGFVFAEPISLVAFGSSPNPSFHSAMPFLGFLVFSVFAYGGTEAMAGVSDDLENPNRDLKKGIAIAGTFIVCFYVLGFLFVGAIMSWSGFPSEGINSMNSLYLIMTNLGIEVGNVFGMKNPKILGEFLMRYTALAIFLSYMGALITLTYAPLKQLIESTPKSYWPDHFQDKNENGVYYNAIKAQMYVVSGFIVLKGISGLFFGDTADELFDMLVTMINVGMTLPYLFLIYAWYKYRTNDKLSKDVILIKPSLVLLATIMTFIIVLFGNAFTIIHPFISGDLNTGIWTVLGPIVFISIATVIANHGEHH